MTFFPSFPSVHENCEREFYLSGSVFLVRFTAPNKQLLSVKSVFKSSDHVSQPANIGPQDVPTTSPSSVPSTSPKDPISPSWGHPYDVQATS